MTEDERRAVAAQIAADMRRAAADELLTAKVNAAIVVALAVAAIAVAWLVR